MSQELVPSIEQQPGRLTRLRESMGKMVNATMEHPMRAAMAAGMWATSLAGAEVAHIRVAGAQTNVGVTYDVLLSGDAQDCGMASQAKHLPAATQAHPDHVVQVWTNSEGQTVAKYDDPNVFGQFVTGPTGSYNFGGDLTHPISNRGVSSPPPPPPPDTYRIQLNWNTTDGSNQSGNFDPVISVTANCTEGMETTAGIAANPNSQGFWTDTNLGSVKAYNGATNYGSMAGKNLNKEVVAIDASRTGQGYYLIASDGGVFTFGDAPFYGSTGSMRLNQPVNGIAETQDGGGYWLVASDGGVFTFGDAPFLGSMGSVRLNKPVVGIVAYNGGYTEVASDGGVFTFGTRFYGSLGGKVLNAPIVGIAPTPDGGGYWMVAADGGVFNFGDATFHGSAASTGETIVGIAPTPDGGGYWLAAKDGRVFNYGDASTATPS